MWPPYPYPSRPHPCVQDIAQDLEAMGPQIPGSEIIITYLALDCLLGLIAGVEALVEPLVQLDAQGQARAGKWA